MRWCPSGPPSPDSNLCGVIGDGYREELEQRVEPLLRSLGLTSSELVETAIALRPELLMRARELTRHAHDAEDLVSDCYLKFVEKPPEPRSTIALRHWLRLVMRNRFIDAQRRRGDREPDVSLELLRGW